MKKLLSGILLFTCAAAFAEWKEGKILLDIKDAETRPEIVTTLAHSDSFQNHLVSLDLASPSKLVVKRISAHISFFKWENDKNCTVAEPERVKEKKLEHIKAIYYFANHPAKFTELGMVESIHSPCHSQKIKRTYTLEKVEN